MRTFDAATAPAGPKGIRVHDPARLGHAIAQLRRRHGLTRMDLARRIAATSGRRPGTVGSQLHNWERLIKAPTVSSLAPVLAALGYDLALIPREKPVVSDLPDLSGVGIGGLTAAEVPAEAVAEAIERASKPGTRISGYNPQRLDDEEGS